MKDSLWKNYAYVYREIWKYQKSLLAMDIMEMLLTVITAFFSVILPSFIIGMLESKTEINLFFLRLLLIFTVYAILNGFQAFLRKRNSMQYIEFRLSYLCKKILTKNLWMDYAYTENDKVKKMNEKANDSIGSNYSSLEGFIHENVKLGTNVLGLLLYSFIITKVNILIAVLLIVISLLQMLLYNKAKNYELGNRDKKAELNVTKHYMQIRPMTDRQEKISGSMVFTNY